MDSDTDYEKEATRCINEAWDRNTSEGDRMLLVQSAQVFATLHLARVQQEAMKPRVVFEPPNPNQWGAR